MNFAFIARFRGTPSAAGTQVSSRGALGWFRAGRISVRPKEAA